MWQKVSTKVFFLPGMCIQSWSGAAVLPPWMSRIIEGASFQKHHKMPCQHWSAHLPSSYQIQKTPNWRHTFFGFLFYSPLNAITIWYSSIIWFICSLCSVFFQIQKIKKPYTERKSHFFPLPEGLGVLNITSILPVHNTLRPCLLVLRKTNFILY